MTEQEKKEDKLYAWTGKVTAYLQPEVPKESVAELFEQIEALKYHFNSWAFPNRSVVVVTRGPKDGRALEIAVFNFDYGILPVAMVERCPDTEVRFILTDERFTEADLRFFMWGVLQLWKAVPWYDPDSIKAPAGFQTTGYLEKMPPPKTETPQ